MKDEKSFWKAVRRKKKLCKKLRKKQQIRKLPVLRAFCERSDIYMTKTKHGYQFRRDEYIINWSPGTNKVTISFRLPGEDKTLPFLRDGQPGKPRIMVALEELTDLVRRERRFS